MNLPRLAVENRIAVNLLMWLIIGGGAWYGMNLTREFFPASDPEQIIITVPFPGATPEEVDQAVTLRVEREIIDTDGVEKMESRIFESVSVTICTLEDGADPELALSDLRGAMDRVRPLLPDAAEEPEIVLVRRFFPAIAVAVYGDIPEETLGDVARGVRDEMLDLPNVKRVTASGLRDREIWAEVQPDKLEDHGLTFEEVGRSIQQVNLDFPGGQIRSNRGNIGVRTLGESREALEIEDIIVSAKPGGGAIRLRDLATVRKTFAEDVRRGRFEGKPAVSFTVFKAPEDDALEISAAVREFVARNPTRLGGAVHLETTTDLSRLIQGRIDLMVRNGMWGLLWVAITLLIFLSARVAFWVVIGMPIAFLGTFAVMNFLGATINMISLFGLITVLGLIVDDAIVIGENVFTRMRQGMHPMRAAVIGTTEVMRPVTAAVLTTIAAFLPLAFLQGTLGTFLRQHPLVVMSALSVSLVEALIILPCHLAHPSGQRWLGLIPSFIRRGFAAVGRFKQQILGEFLPGVYEVLLRLGLRWRYVSLAGAVAVLLLTVGLLLGGIVPFVLIQNSDAETVTVDLEMAAGTSERETTRVIEQLENVSRAVPEVLRVTSVLGSIFTNRGQDTAADPATVGQLTLELIDTEERHRQGLRRSSEVVASLREAIPEIPGCKRLRVSERAAGPGGPDIEIRVRGEDLEALRRAVDYVKEELGTYAGVAEIEDDLKVGKLEFRLQLRDSARALGLTERDLALQVRHALFGFEVQRLQEEDQEVRLRVLLPEEHRRDLAILGNLRITTRTGHQVPLEEVADLSSGRGYATLTRVDGKRAATVLADVDETRGNTSRITADVAQQLASIGAVFPGCSVAFEGRRKETRESLGSLRLGFSLVMFLIYAIIAILFKSYFQPLLVMVIIPFAFVGAVLGHMIAGYPFTLLSLIGGVALTGIVVNDSLILVDFINRRRRDGVPTLEAVVLGGRDRLRAILLTSITTIAGLAPLMLEKSFQAQFLIPMAVSIVYGLAFATVLVLGLLPVIYAIAEDFRVHKLVEPEAPNLA